MGPSSGESRINPHLVMLSNDQMPFFRRHRAAHNLWHAMAHDRALLEALGRRIKELRIRRELTQQQLGERASLAPKYVSELERGLRNPSLTTLHRLCTAGLGASMAVLLFGLEEAGPSSDSPRRQPRRVLEADAPYLLELEALLGHRQPPQREQLLGLFRRITEVLDVEARPLEPRPRRVRRKRPGQSD